MIQQVLGARHVDGAYWSLQVELFFYAAMLVLFRLGAFRRPLATLTAWVLTGVAVHLLLAVAGDQFAGGAAALRKVQTLCSLKYIHLFAVGIVFHEIYRAGRVAARHAAVILLCLTAHLVMDSPVGAGLVAAFVTLFYLITSGRLTFLAARPLVWLGSISYPLYLVHQNIGYIVIRQLNAWGVNSNVSVAVACGLALALATAVSLLVERPAGARIKGVYRTVWANFAPAIARPDYAPRRHGGHREGDVLRL